MTRASAFRHNAAGWLLFLTIFASLASAFSSHVSSLVPGIMIWVTSFLLIPDLKKAQRWQIGVLMGVGVLGLTVGELRSANSEFLWRAAGANEVITAMLLAVSFLRIISALPEGVDKPLPNGSEEFWVTGFCCGKSALAATSIPSSVAVQRFLAQLATIFEGTEVCGKFIRGEVHDWSKDRFIRGGYSYPSSTELPRARQVLAEPLSSRLYFAGEATNTRCFMTLHGAIDSGCRAASEVLRDLRGARL